MPNGLSDSSSATSVACKVYTFTAQLAWREKVIPSLYPEEQLAAQSGQCEETLVVAHQAVSYNQRNYTDFTIIIP